MLQESQNVRKASDSTRRGQTVYNKITMVKIKSKILKRYSLTNTEFITELFTNVVFIFFYDNGIAVVKTVFITIVRTVVVIIFRTVVDAFR